MGAICQEEKEAVDYEIQRRIISRKLKPSTYNKLLIYKQIPNPVWTNSIEL